MFSKVDALLAQCQYFCKLAHLDAITRTSQLIIDPMGMREESMDLVRKQRHASEKMRPIVVTVYVDGTPVLNDGRHRLAIAKELRDTSIAAKIIYYDKDLNIVKQELRDLIIDN